tara:strand:+ start:1801 stop:3981 length:2181 start_codon:yes stop_codon:yes gene_type:complete
MGKELKFYKIFLEKVWPKYRSDFYSALYDTFHPSGYDESFQSPRDNWGDAIQYLDAAISEGEKLGYLVIGNSKGLYRPFGGQFATSQVNHIWDWQMMILYFDVLEDIVDEFRCYCGSNGTDPNCEGACMDEFPPTDYSYKGNVGRWAGGTLKEDYYITYEYIMAMAKSGIPVGDLIGEDKLELINLKTLDNEIMSTGFPVPEDLSEQEDTSEKEEETKTIFQKTLKDMGVQLKFVGTFGFGISGMFGMVKDLLEGRYPSLSEGEIILIFLSALSYLSINLSKDMSQVNDEIKKRGLKDFLSKTVEALKDFENISLKIVEKAGFTVSSLSELLGYTFLLVPILDITNRLINENGFDVISLASYLKGAILSVGIFYIRNVFNSLVVRLRELRQKRELYGDNIGDDVDGEVIDDLDDELIEEGKYVGITLARKFSESQVINESRIGELSLLDDSDNNKDLKWIVNEENRIKWVSTPIAKILKEFKENQKLFTKSNIIEVTDKFKDKDPKDLNNYRSIYELNNITKLLIHKSKLHEEVYMGRIAEKATTDVCKDIFEVIKTFDGIEEYYELPSDINSEEMYEYGDLVFDVELTVYRYDIKETFNVDAEMGGEHDDTIFVDVILGDDFSKQDYENLYIILSEYVRHEVEHVLQEIDPERPDVVQKTGNLSPFEYYSQEHEVDAQRAGFERRAKMSDKSTEDVVRDYIEYRQSIDQLSDGEKKELISLITSS